MKHPATAKTTVTVEFFGIPRDRAGTAKTAVDSGTLGEVLDQLGDQRRLEGELARFIGLDQAGGDDDGELATGGEVSVSGVFDQNFV